MNSVLGKLFRKSIFLLIPAATFLFAASAAKADVTSFSTSNLSQWAIVSGGAPTSAVSWGSLDGITGLSPVNDVNGFWTATYTFSLSTASGVTLNYSSFVADDRGVMLLNNNVVGSWGIFSPGIGAMQLTNGGAEAPFDFSTQNGNVAASGSFSSGFVSGVNTLQFVINNTNNGIYGSTHSGGPTWLAVQGNVVVQSVPEPETYAMLLAGLGLMGGIARRRKQK